MLSPSVLFFKASALQSKGAPAPQSFRPSTAREGRDRGTSGHRGKGGRNYLKIRGGVVVVNEDWKGLEGGMGREPLDIQVGA